MSPALFLGSGDEQGADVCCVASWVGRDTDSEQGGGAVAREGTMGLRALIPSGKRVGTTPLLCFDWGLQHPLEQSKHPEEGDMFLHKP